MFVDCIDVRYTYHVKLVSESKCENGHYVRERRRTVQPYYLYEPIDLQFHNDTGFSLVPFGKSRSRLYHFELRKWEIIKLDELWEMDDHYPIEDVLSRERLNEQMRKEQTKSEVIAWMLIWPYISGMNRDVAKLIGQYVMLPPYDFPLSIKL